MIARVEALLTDRWRKKPSLQLSEVEAIREQRYRKIPELLAALEEFPKRCAASKRSSPTGARAHVSKKPAVARAHTKVVSLTNHAGWLR